MQVEIEPPFVIFKAGVSERAFYELASEDANWEYLDGRLVMHSPASDHHEDLFGFLATLLRAYLDETGRGYVRGSRYPMRLDESRSPEPDLLVVRPENRQRLTPRRLEGPADFVIEIASDSDPHLDEREKLPRYQSAGIEEIWLIRPQNGTLSAHLRTAGSYASRTLAAGRLDAVVVPGFWIEVDWLWQEPLPPTLGCLKRILDSEA